MLIYLIGVAIWIVLSLIYYIFLEEELTLYHLLFNVLFVSLLSWAVLLWLTITIIIGLMMEIAEWIEHHDLTIFKK